MRAVLDPNVLISASISPGGTPSELIRRWRRGDFELVVSPALLAELERALSYPKLAPMISAEDAATLLAWLQVEAEQVEDSFETPSIRSSDPGDDYLVALSMSQGAALVSGDNHLLALSSDLPIYRPAEFLALLDSEAASGSS